MDDAIKKFCDKFRNVLINGGSINDFNENINKNLWTKENFQNLCTIIEKNLQEDSRKFEDKIIQQLDEAKKIIPSLSQDPEELLLPLLIDVLSIYYIYPSEHSISKETKENTLKHLIRNYNLKVSDIIINAFKSGGVGGSGVGYNTNKYHEIIYLIKLLKSWYEEFSTREERAEFFKSNNDMPSVDKLTEFQNLLDDEGISGGRSVQIRHALLYFLFPQYYTRVISKDHKEKIITAFSFLYNEDELNKHCNGYNFTYNIDQKIYLIRENLKSIQNANDIDFYDNENVRVLWARDTSDYCSNFNMELIDYKKQMILYGPPGTSKTHTAETLARDIIRYKTLKNFRTQKASNQITDQKQFFQEMSNKIKGDLSPQIHRLQLHPAYSYEEFIGGIQFKNGTTSFEKGFILKLQEEMKKILICHTFLFSMKLIELT